MQMPRKFTLRAARVNRGYTQKRASREIGVSEQTLSNWERGISYPTVADVEKILRVYGLESMDEIQWRIEILLAKDIENPPHTRVRDTQIITNAQPQEIVPLAR
jgi:transcriptional regulator with XRE-family HTH domain